MAKIINFTEFVTGKFAELSNKFQRKHDQYKGSGGELANFRTGALLKYGKADMESMYETLKDYMRKHVAYMETHGLDGSSLGDSLGDIAVYCVIAMYMRECYMQDQQREE